VDTICIIIAATLRITLCSSNINWRDDQRKNVVNNVDMSSLRSWYIYWNAQSSPKKSICHFQKLEMILKWNKQNTVRLPQKYQFVSIKHKINC